MSEKLFAVITVARQVDGEYVFVKTEKAFKKASKADEYMKKLNEGHRSSDGKYNLVRLSTPQGEADCYCTTGAFEIDVE